MTLPAVLVPAVGRRGDRYGADRVDLWCILLARASGAVRSDRGLDVRGREPMMAK
ncbi:hypothetical protein ACWCPF_24560 [Streptomyces sp. NPDC001858]